MPSSPPSPPPCSPSLLLFLGLLFRGDIDAIGRFNEGRNTVLIAGAGGGRVTGLEVEVESEMAANADEIEVVVSDVGDRAAL
tara:strand:- start:134 stop:379 length:246 start_codon:yes stop_codon:yes gene_type:complete